MKKGFLKIEGLGTFEGEIFGNEKEVSGELVFNTSPSGYLKSMSDPSYRGQILIFSFPFIGAYELNEEWESSEIQVRGVILNNVPRIYKERISNFLDEKGIPGIIIRETRNIIDFIRVNGNKIGTIGEAKFENPYEKNLVDEVSIKSMHFENDDRPRILLVDLGLKGNILRFLKDFDISIIPYKEFTKRIALNYEGIVISNGPGDPSHAGLLSFRDEVGKISGEVPILGICLGHQIVGLSFGMRTEKMKFGHRSINHPVKDIVTGNIGITTHNHGFTVLFMEGMGLEKRYISLNDQSNEGMQGKNIITTQFHPEGGPGPKDELRVFENFRRMVDNAR